MPPLTINRWPARLGMTGSNGADRAAWPRRQRFERRGSAFSGLTEVRKGRLSLHGRHSYRHGCGSAMKRPLDWARGTGRYDSSPAADESRVSCSSDIADDRGWSKSVTSPNDRLLPLKAALPVRPRRQEVRAIVHTTRSQLENVALIRNGAQFARTASDSRASALPAISGRVLRPRMKPHLHILLRLSPTNSGSIPSFEDMHNATRSP